VRQGEQPGSVEQRRGLEGNVDHDDRDDDEYDRLSGERRHHERGESQ
jgi:hypothetical protein